MAGDSRNRGNFLHGQRHARRVLGTDREPRTGVWIIGNGRVGVSFDMQHTTGRLGDPSEVPADVRACVGTEFATVMALLLETGDECWLGEVRAAAPT